jgi:hypothetical protein
MNRIDGLDTRYVAPSPNKQLQRTVIPQHMRATSASFHYALAVRSKGQRAAAELRRDTTRTTFRVALVDVRLRLSCASLTAS